MSTAHRKESLGSRTAWAISRPLGIIPMPQKAWRIALILLVPALAMRLFTSVYPFVQTVIYSFTNASPMEPERKWIGLANYQDLFTDRIAIGAMVFTAVFAGVSTLLELVVGLALALLLNSAFRMRGLARATVLIPWAIPAIVTALGFRFMFSDGFGIIPDLLSHVGITVSWLTDPLTAKVAVILTNSWRSAPFVALIILAGLQGIPEEVYQAAKVDGAGYVRTVWSIVIPLVAPLLITMGTFMLIFQVGGFDIILGMTGGGPGTATQVLSYLAYQEAFINLQYGRASAIAIVLFAMVLVIGLVAMRFFNRREVEL